MENNKKIISDALIEELLLQKGFKEDLDYDEQLLIIQNHYDCCLSTDWLNNKDFYCYSEGTADGYTLHIATHDPDNINIGEDVHYYDFDIARKLEYAMSGGLNIYIEDENESYVQEAIENVYAAILEEVTEQIIENLEDEGYEKE